MNSILNDILDTLRIERKPIFTIAETQKILGLSRSRLASLQREGKLRAVRTGENRVLGIGAGSLAAYLISVNEEV